MENQAVIEAFVREFFKVFHGQRRDLFVEFPRHDLSVFQFQCEFFHLIISLSYISICPVFSAGLRFRPGIRFQKLSTSDVAIRFQLFSWIVQSPSARSR